MKYSLKVKTIWEIGQRENQEDCIFPAKSKENSDDRVFILCDGMGGHEAGEVASQTVCDAMSKYLLERCSDENCEFTDDTIKSAVNSAFDALDGLMDEEMSQSKKMGTTMTCLVLHSKGYTIAHMGDSRVYHIRPGKKKDETQIVHVTRDHSLINDLIAIGELTEEEAKHSTQKNVITRAMQPGMERRPEPEVYHSSDIQAGDIFYLCSDGMLEEMNDKNIMNLFSKFRKDEQELAELLKAHTKDNQDNHSAIIIRVLKVISDENGKGKKSWKQKLSQYIKNLFNRFDTVEVVPDTNQGIEQ